MLNRIHATALIDAIDNTREVYGGDPKHAAELVALDIELHLAMAHVRGLEHAAMLLRDIGSNGEYLIREKARELRERWKL